MKTVKFQKKISITDLWATFIEKISTSFIVADFQQSELTGAS